MLEGAIADAVVRPGVSFVVSSGQRLARTMRRYQAAHVSESQASSWQGPAIGTWEQFVRHCFRLLMFDARLEAALPRVLSPEAEHIYWQRAVEQAISDGPGDAVSVVAVAREAARTWRRAVEWQVGIDDIRRSAGNEETDFFLRCLQTLQKQLGDESILDVETANVICAHAPLLQQSLGGKVVLAGFNRLTPQQHALSDALGCTVIAAPQPEAAPSDEVRVFETVADELRGAGQWAREWLERDPDARLAIVVTNLSEQVERARREVVDGLLPHERLAVEAAESARLELSLGQSLASVPAVTDALAFLRWAARGGNFDIVSRLNRSLGNGQESLRLERRLRARRDQSWHPRSLLAFAAAGGNQAPAWLSASNLLALLANDRRLPSDWATSIDEALAGAGWLRAETLSSTNFQLRTQWQGCLDAVVALDEVCGPIALSQVVGLVESLAGDRVFSAEQQPASVLLCGPLETTGLTFDAVWVAGMDNAQWPPPGRALSMLSNALQRRFSMPDASPEQTREFWRRQWLRLRNCSPVVVESHARFVDGRERLPASGAVDRAADVATEQCAPSASRLLGTLAVARVEERFPAWSTGQAVRGGHSILRLLGSDPFQAQILARWNVRPLEQPRFGIDPRLRGVLIHRALELAYGQVSETAPVPTDDVVVAAVDSAFRSELRSTDPVYRALLRREATRALGLLRAFIQLDGQREAMHVDALESRMSLTLAGVSFDLRADRIDRAEQGLLIIDYKTGFRDTRAAVRKGTFDQVAQLAAYALASDYEVSGVAVATLHPRSVAFRGIYSTAETRLPGDGARKGDPSLEDCQAQWLDDASARAATLARGECWLNLQVPASDWLPLGPLSRIAEVRRYG